VRVAMEKANEENVELDKKTTIQISVGGRRQLANMARHKSESYEEIIMRLINFWRKGHAKPKSK